MLKLIQFGADADCINSVLRSIFQLSQDFPDIRKISLCQTKNRLIEDFN